MKQGARLDPRPPILEAEAHSFGMGPWATGKRGKGTLTLSDASLTFHPAGRSDGWSIPLSEIEHVSVSMRPPRSRVLVVTYRGNLVAGLALDQAETWANAMQALTGVHRKPPRRFPPLNPGIEFRRFRLVVGLFLLVVVLLSTALPLFFTWMSARIGGASSPPAPRSAPGF